MRDALRTRLPPNADVDAVEFDPWLKRVRRFLGGESSKRQELFSELNFAAFYIHELFPDYHGRVLYLDTDVVVLGDVQAELSEFNLKGKPAAAVKDCSQKVRKYILWKNLDVVDLDQLPLKLEVRPKDCVVNRGVVLIDTDAWAQWHMTATIEALITIHLSDKGPLWRSGVSQPPFLLTIAGHYVNMGWQYNVRGLGRNDMSVDEVKHFKHSKMWQKYYDYFLFICKFGDCRNIAFSPSISPRAHRAKVLHFNGRLKPMDQGRRIDTPLARPEKNMSDKVRRSFETRPLCSCGEACMQECAGLWWRYNGVGSNSKVKAAKQVI